MKNKARMAEMKNQKDDQTGRRSNAFVTDKNKTEQECYKCEKAGHLITGIPNERETEFMKCKTCIEYKMHNSPFKNNRTKAKDILEIIRTDVCGSFQTVGTNEEKYFVSSVDDYSKVSKIYCIKFKAEVFDCLVLFRNRRPFPHPATIRESLPSMSGGMFKNRVFPSPRDNPREPKGPGRRACELRHARRIHAPY